MLQHLAQAFFLQMRAPVSVKVSAGLLHADRNQNLVMAGKRRGQPGFRDLSAAGDGLNRYVQTGKRFLRGEGGGILAAEREQIPLARFLLLRRLPSAVSRRIAFAGRSSRRCRSRRSGTRPSSWRAWPNPVPAPRGGRPGNSCSRRRISGRQPPPKASRPVP
jgi:hypothetical protein